MSGPVFHVGNSHKFLDRFPESRPRDAFRHSFRSDYLHRRAWLRVHLAQEMQWGLATFYSSRAYIERLERQNSSRGLPVQLGKVCDELVASARSINDSG